MASSSSSSSSFTGRSPLEGLLAGPTTSISSRMNEEAAAIDDDCCNLNDPTLDTCCRRELEAQRRGQALKQILQQHDRVAARERARLNLVHLNNFSGCRCSYDPNSDGGGDYQALLELRNLLLQEESQAEEPLRVEANDEKKVDRDVDSCTSDDDDEELDAFLEDFPQDEATKAWEEQRRLELEDAMWHRQRAMEHGYGVHRPMHPTRILRAAGLRADTSSRTAQAHAPLPPPPAVVIHLVDPESKASASLDVYLETLAQDEARGTKFMRSGGRSTLLMDSALAEKVLPCRLSPETDLPALIAVRDGVVVNVCPRLQGLVDNSTSTSNDERMMMILPRQVHEWLDRAGVLLTELPSTEEVCRIRPEEEALMSYLAVSNTSDSMNKEPLHEYYNCGISDCQKTYPHQHVGIETDQQSGLVVASSDSAAAVPQPSEVIDNSANGASS